MSRDHLANMNDRAWLRTAIAYIKLKNLEQEFVDFCGGFKCPLLAERAKGEPR